MAAKLGRLTARFRSEAGFGLVELMIALIVLAVGILATIGVFQTSLLHLGRATKVSTAAAVGEQQMENFRAVKFDAIGLEPTAFATAVTDSTYTGDTACKSTCTVAGSANGQTVTVAGGFLPEEDRDGRRREAVPRRHVRHVADDHERPTGQGHHRRHPRPEQSREDVDSGYLLVRPVDRSVARPRARLQRPRPVSTAQPSAQMRSR